jgi:predicted DsbA family dithiol-disulfide isomerase
MQVEIFSDIVCPWCAIGERRFEAALAQFEHAAAVEVRWRSFELDHDAPAVCEGDLASHIASKYRITREQAVAAQQRLAATAANEGLDFRFEQTQRGNTFDAHRLLHWAHTSGRQDALKERLFAAYFTEGAAIGERATLVRLCDAVGLDPAEADRVLMSREYVDAVRADEAEARSLGVSGVPFFVIDRRFAIAGAEQPAAILEALRNAWATASPLVPASSAGEGACVGDRCDI